MSPTPILITACASLLSTACFVLVAVALRKRRYSPELRLAGQAYTLWWAMFAFQALTDALRVLMGLREPVNADVYVALAAMKIVAAGVGTWALGRYVLFLWNGRRWASVPIMLLAAAHAAFYLFSMFKGLPARVVVDTWSPRLILEGPGTGIQLGVFGLLLYFAPPIILATCFLLLRRRLETHAQKVRVTSIALSILVFQVVAIIQFNPNTPADSALFAILPLVNAAVGLFVLTTYVPPAWAKRHFGMESVEQAQRLSKGAPEPKEPAHS